MLQGGAVLQGVERHHAIVVIGCQKQDGGVGMARVRWGRQIVERRVPGEKVRKTSWKENVRREERAYKGFVDCVMPFCHTSACVRPATVITTNMFSCTGIV